MNRLVVLFILVAAACGGSTDPSTGSTSPQTVPVAETAAEGSVDINVQGVVDAIVASHGEDGGFDAVIWAFERGYSGDQLFAGALEGRLQADGVITAAAGGTETPDGSPLGLITLPTPELQSLEVTAVPAVYRADSQMLAAFQGTTVEEFKKLLGPKVGGLLVIVDAARAGYSGQQIIELIIENGSIDYLDRPGIDDLSNSCTFLRDGTGQIVVPGIVASELDFARADCIKATSELAEAEKAAREVAAGSDDSATAPDEEPVLVQTEPITVVGTMTSGIIIDAANIVDVLVNEIEFVVPPDDGEVRGTGKASRRTDTGDVPALSDGGLCRDVKVSPLGFEFTGSFDGPDRTAVSGEFTWRVVAEELVQEGTCPPSSERPGFTGFGAGGGSFTAIWSATELTLTGEFTVSSGAFGTTSFEASAPAN